MAPGDHRTPSDRAARWAANLGRVSEAALAFRDTWRQSQTPGPGSASQQVTQQHRAALERHQRDLRKYRSRLARLRRRARIDGGIAVTGAVIAAADLVTAGPEFWFWLGAPTAVIGATAALGRSREAGRLRSPAKPEIPPPPAVPLPEGWIGHDESTRLAGTRLQLIQIIPEIRHLHGGAGQEISSADAEAAPELSALVHRLALLNQVISQSPNTPAARSADRSARDLQRWLGDGVEMYEQLLRASVELLGAPGAQQVATNRLHESVDELTAFSEGLRRSAETIPPVAGSPSPEDTP